MRLTATDRDTLRILAILVACSTVGGALFGIAIARICHVLGRSVLAKFLTGYYYRGREYRARKEERIFMFVDLVGSTTTAERIGQVAFHRLMNDFIRAATEPVLAARGEIHDYVGDEIIVTWKPERSLKQGRCVRCFDNIRRALEALAAAYANAYGIEPKIRAALHIGTVAAGEMGLVKLANVCLGDTLKTTARIEAGCKELDADLLISADLADRLAGVAGWEFADFGSVALRSRSEPVRPYSPAA